MTKNAANNWKPMGPSISTEDINRSILAAAASVSPYSGQFSATLAAAVARASAQAQANAFQMLMAQAQLQQLQASVELQALVQAEQKRRDSEKVLQNLSTQMSGVSASHSEEKGKPGMTSHDLAPRPQLAAQPSADAVVAAQVNGPVQLDSRSGPLLGTGKTPSGHASGHEIVPAQSKPHNGVTPPTGDVAAVHPQVSDTGPSIVAPTPAPIPAPTPAPTPVPGGGIDINSLTQLTALAAKTPGFGANLLGLGLPLLMQSSGQLSSNISKVLSQLQAQARQPTFPAPGSSTSRDMGLSGPAESAVNQAGGRGQPHPDPSETSNTKTEAGGGAHPAPAGPDSVSETLGRRLRRQVPAKIKDEADVSVTAAAASAPLRRSLRSEPGPLPTVLSSPLGTSMPSGSRSSAAKNPQGAVRRASRSAVSVRVEGERNAGEMDVDVAADDALGKQR
ncbi:uncharacterized protein BJ171DRAFT_582090 [Polychytrium aggregatum]|uniref:uncharacterized protein n=1 Tax=Polychytrium aggregatum TaxID=110093 RepID=UPI0022FEC60A|nr:uncharacterized protein BJ171DRAFT_582090 [Polychytrium aggregatum]KAI9204526.1 hypothetical protein BJ171DRAFT_582090 [Polychytrium aggregatum]